MVKNGSEMANSLLETVGLKMGRFHQFRPFFTHFVLDPVRCTLEKGSEMQKNTKNGQKWTPNGQFPWRIGFIEKFFKRAVFVNFDRFSPFFTVFYQFL